MKVMRIKAKPLLLSVLAVGILGYIGLLLSGGLSVGANSNEGSIVDNVKKAVAPAPKPKIVDTTTFDTTVNQLIASHSGLDVGTSITDLKTGKSYQYGDTSAYTAASVNKLVTAFGFIHKVEQGQATMQDTVGGYTAQEQIRKMLVNSDNTAWKSFYVASILPCSAQNTYAHELGLTSYDCVSNAVNAADINTLLTKLYNKQLLNAEHTDLVLGYMKQANYRQYIVAAVPTSLTVYHKVGFLEDRVHDAAIIDDGKHAYVLVIFTKTKSTIYPMTSGTELIHSITSNANQTFLTNRKEITAPESTP
jgi:beta-lactamase class A